ncbi:hypothetical protein I6F33_25180 [Bradyrhizobium sp. BRP20]|uniref:hypothetical protein n=1 Tax=unclassified Bradyrhizobium TaxID=2631580 RepID=UPI001CD28B3B|nr:MULTISPECIES: hypothetical protein [unclassified Bradyrhizobium]MCA1436253.1 hypothetical protein [Bradyrhizobium sp. BRP20]MCA1471919.1 hypothetical protein [Bradyrhizobium sp. IC3195]MCA1551741.1 hypothetical protein [Bradyrhizobium sp. BRP19]
MLLEVAVAGGDTLAQNKRTEAQWLRGNHLAAGNQGRTNIKTIGADINRLRVVAELVVVIS